MQLQRKYNGPHPLKKKRKKERKKSRGTSHSEHKRSKIIIDYVFYKVITEQLDGME